MSIASRYKQACRPSSPRISSRKKSGSTRLPMNRPCRSVNMQSTVSTSPASARASSCFASSMPWTSMQSSSCVGVTAADASGAGGVRPPAPDRAETRRRSTDRFQLPFDSGQLLWCALHLGSGEPPPRREGVPEPHDKDHRAHHDRRVVEDVDELDAVAPVELRQAEDHAEERDPDHGDPADDLALRAERPRPRLE